MKKTFCGTSNSRAGPHSKLRKVKLRKVHAQLPRVGNEAASVAHVTAKNTLFILLFEEDIICRYGLPMRSSQITGLI